MTTRTEVRRDDSGVYWLWELTESDVPGEGGARRVGQVDLIGTTRHELDLRQQIESARAQLARLEAQLANALVVKAQLEAAQG
jgi:hypothetical protein